ncbi:hypothetical protein VNO77_04796 [Canavalia gladiata]|uniref:Uncharacterized protein n=1 Tax=Canavalia gladiata TaxID=3824 RepID=A0AAN9R827_CANGL
MIRPGYSINALFAQQHTRIESYSVTNPANIGIGSRIKAIASCLWGLFLFMSRRSHISKRYTLTASDAGGSQCNCNSVRTLDSDLGPQTIMLTISAKVSMLILDQQTGFIYTPQTIGAVLILAELLTAKRSKLTDTRAVKQNQCQRFRLIGTYSGSPTETFTAEHSRCENPKA